MVGDTHEASRTGFRVRLRSLWIQWCAMQDDLPVLTEPPVAPQPLAAASAGIPEPTVGDGVASCADGRSAFGLSARAGLHRARMGHRIRPGTTTTRPWSDHRRHWS